MTVDTVSLLTAETGHCTQHWEISRENRNKHNENAKMKAFVFWMDVSLFKAEAMTTTFNLVLKSIRTVNSKPSVVRRENWKPEK